MIQITCEHYKDTDRFIIFINGFALNKNSCTYFVAYELAKAAGQKQLKTKIYHDLDKPVPHYVTDDVA
jgi:hypothetical protein